MDMPQLALTNARSRATEQPAWYRPVSLHNRRVRSLAGEIAAGYGLAAEQLMLVAWAAGWHDLGKLDLGAALVNKPGRLSDAEWALMRRHPRLGALHAQRLGAPHAVVVMIDAHHERWDGKGYGAGLVGHQIPIGAQIISIADVFDAMTSERPYKRAMAVEEVLEHMAAERERAFRPDLLDLALSLLEARAPLRYLVA